jgi:hypothetical protein
MTPPKSTRASEVPLYVIPQVITRMIRERGYMVYRISVVRTHHHHYNISVRTRSIPRELRPPVPVRMGFDEDGEEEEQE